MTINEIQKQFKDVNNFHKIFEVSKKSRSNFQRLEFLGDRVLGLVLAYKLYTKYTDYDEGKMAKFYAYLTSGKVLAKIAKKIILDKYLGRNGIKNITDNVLADFLEAILGAFFLDNGYAKTTKLILEIYNNEFEKDNNGWGDYKSVLQEWSQGNEFGLPIYNLVIDSIILYVQ